MSFHQWVYECLLVIILQCPLAVKKVQNKKVAARVRKKIRMVGG